MAGNPRGLGWQEEAPVLAEADMLGWGEGSGVGDGGCSGGEGATGPPCPGLGLPPQASRAGWGKKALNWAPRNKSSIRGAPCPPALPLSYGDGCASTVGPFPLPVSMGGYAPWRRVGCAWLQVAATQLRCPSSSSSLQHFSPIYSPPPHFCSCFSEWVRPNSNNNHSGDHPTNIPEGPPLPGGLLQGWGYTWEDARRAL